MKCRHMVMVMSLMLVSTCVYAETPPDWGSVSTAGGRGRDGIMAIKTDRTGKRFMTGYFSARARFGSTVLVSAGGTDIFLHHPASAGRSPWLLRAGGPGEDSGHDVALDRDGNVCMTGFFTDTATFPSTDGTSRTVSGNGETIFIAKYNPAGILQWLHTGDGENGINRGAGVAIQSLSGSCYVTGVSQGTTTFSSSDGIPQTVSGPGTWHMVLVKYDANGQFQWGQSNTASPNSVPYKVATDSSGVYVTGWFEGVATFLSRNGHHKTVTGLSGPVQVFPYPDDAFIVKYSHQGNVQWINQIGGYKAITVDIATSQSGGISITGFIGNIDGTPAQRHTIATSQPGGADIDLGGGVYTDPVNANRDIVVATYDRQGILLDAQRIGGAGEENGTGVAYDRQGNLYVTGMFQSTLAVGDQVLTGVQEHNLFVLKYADTGLVWAKKADGAATEDWQAGYPRLTITPKNKVLVSGGFRGSAVFDGLTRTSRGQEDMFVGSLPQPPTGLLESPF